MPVLTCDADPPPISPMLPVVTGPLKLNGWSTVAVALALACRLPSSTPASAAAAASPRAEFFASDSDDIGVGRFKLPSSPASTVVALPTHATANIADKTCRHIFGPHS
jgi:hypothetical protein